MLIFFLNSEHALIRTPICIKINKKKINKKKLKTISENKNE